MKRAPPRRPRPSAAHRLELVGELASLINQTFDLDELFRAAILKLRGVMAFRRASVALVTEDRRAYRLHTLYDAAREGFIAARASFPIDAGITGQALRTGAALRLDDVHGTDGIRLEGEGRVSVLVIPLRLGGEVIGALNLGAETGAAYDDRDLELGVVLGRQIETSLHYSRLFATIERQREHLQAALTREQSERSALAALIEASDAAVLMVSGDAVLHANRAFARLIALPWEVVMRLPLAQVHDALARALDDRTALEPQIAALQRGEELRDRVELRDVSGLSAAGRLVCQRTVAPVRDRDGAVRGHVVMYRDVTKEAAAEAAKDEFVSIVSHELRTPLTSINTSLDLLSRGAVRQPEAAAELVDIARRNLARLIRLVDDLLDLSRLRSGRIVTERRPTSATDAAAHARQAVQAFADARGVTLLVHLPPAPLTVLADADRLAQVFVNLLANAIKFSPEGGEVRLTGSAAGGAARFEIADQGPGIPADKLEVIFDKFVRLETAATGSHGGAGLGLAISRGIVVQLGGRIWAESPAGRGSRFLVELPLAPEPARAAALPASGSLIVVDGDAGRAALVAAAFRERGWTAAVLERGADAVERAARGADLIVIGAELNDMHGLECLRQIRSSPEGAALPALLVGSVGAQQARTYGADGWPSAAGEVVEQAARALAAPRRPVVLLVEDDPEVRQALRRSLLAGGYGCLEAAAGDAALVLARRRPPDVIVTDLHLPRQSGVALLAELRAEPRFARTPAIVVTAHADAAAGERIRALAARLLHKPFDPRDLMDLIGRLRGGASESGGDA